MDIGRFGDNFDSDEFEPEFREVLDVVFGDEALLIYDPDTGQWVIEKLYNE
jgi:hypothetical protein